jgi:hypothetical protein
MQIGHSAGRAFNESLLIRASANVRGAADGSRATASPKAKTIAPLNIVALACAVHKLVAG